MRVLPLLEAPGVYLYRASHEEAYVATTVEEEISSGFGVAFVDSGEFKVGIADRRWRLQRGDALLSYPDVVHVYQHDADRPADTCTCVRFRGTLASEIDRHGHFAVAKNVAIAPRTNRLAFLRWRLNAIDDPMALEEWGSDFVDASRQPPGAERQYRQLDWYAERIENARRMLQTQFGDEHTLVSLASAAGMSPFHFARLFRELVGTPPHRYLRDIRLNRAASMLRDGASVTLTCYDVGFSNLSHFIRSFRKRFGSSPSEQRKKVQAKSASNAR